MAITKKDIEKLSGIVSTKEDLKEALKRFVTKEDLREELKRFATKEDLREELKRFATKEDLKKYATKDDLKAFEGKTLTMLDQIMGELEKAREDRIFAKAKDDEQDNRLDTCERKIIILEKAKV